MNKIDKTSEEYKAKRREWQKNYRLRNPDKVKESSSRYTNSHREELNTKHKIYRDSNPEKEKARNKKYYQNHKEELKAYQKEYNKNNHSMVLEKARARTIKRKYGISLSEYDSLLSKQNGKCYICKTEDNFGRCFCVDHDHLTGKVRGLLCGPCNQALGLFKDNLELLENAMTYLRIHENVHSYS